MSNLLLFTNSYPFGNGETFLDDEIPYLACRFSEIYIHPLYIPADAATLSINNKNCFKFKNIKICEALIPFDHKDKNGLIRKGLKIIPPLWQITEFFSKGCFLHAKRLRLFFNYALIYNSIVADKSLVNKILCELNECSVAYFYWGDKSALLVPELKKLIAHKFKKSADKMPAFVVRFHGSDLYEEVKGYLPFRKHLLPQIDYAVTISKNGKEYIKNRYPNIQPKNVCTYRLGSCGDIIPKRIGPEFEGSLFHIISCSNIIPLKRVGLIADALKIVQNDVAFLERMWENGYDGIKWTHIGDGPLINEIKTKIALEEDGEVVYDLKGEMEHNNVLSYYRQEDCDLFVQVSSSEGVPVSIMEALSFGIPVLATNVGGVGEIVYNRDLAPFGKLVNADITATNLATEIENFILLSPDKLLNMKRAARTEWELGWDSTKNYSAFADFLKAM